MKEITVSQFKLMKASEIKGGGSFNLVADGMPIAIVVVPVSAVKRQQIEAICSQMNVALGIKD